MSTPTILPLRTPPGATGEQDTPLRATGEQDTPLRATGEQALCLRGIRQLTRSDK